MLAATVAAVVVLWLATVLVRVAVAMLTGMWVATAPVALGLVGIAVLGL